MASDPPTFECRLTNASLAAYSIRGGNIDPSAPGYDKIGLKQGTVPTVFTSGLDQINAGYVAETQDNWVFLVFRGTLPPFEGDFWRWIKDWLNDFQIGPTTWTMNGESFGRAETGFASAVLDLWPKVLDALEGVNPSAKNGIIVTGHSKGAAMSVLAASLLKGEYFRNLLVKMCGFAGPRMTDRTFRDNYDALGLGTLSVRYANEYDVAPFLFYWPILDVLAKSELLSNASQMKNAVITEAVRQKARENDYVPIGLLRFITTDCCIEDGEKAETDAVTALKDALLHLRFGEIVDAHAADGRYLTCVCSPGPDRHPTNHDTSQHP